MSRKKKSGHTKEKRGFAFYIFPLISLIVAIWCISYIIKWVGQNGANKEVLESIIGDTVEVDEETGETQIDFAKLKQKNSDTVGWLKVNGTNVDYPIVQAVDNDYYMTRNFNKEDNVAGWLFVDYRMKLDGTDKNIVIYGHNMKDGSMFGDLKKKAKSKEWYNNEENLNIIFQTETEIRTYKVFSTYEKEKETYYTKASFASNEEYQTFLDTLKSRSVKDFGINLTTNDKILTLSTCASNSNNRVVVHAVLTDTIQSV